MSFPRFYSQYSFELASKHFVFNSVLSFKELTLHIKDSVDINTGTTDILDPTHFWRLAPDMV